ncbi:acyltransferase [Pseudanabaena sp. UWO310]|uniref:acyltransferase n=1 Tax=Pseudanabaena sp. UWO310 TaxID=2480795 RepID=UPI001158E62D|nr:acyltransferase [Pseudanabaena sp. UWO310]TYQ30635.1 acyltransferase [Pseudanabaena sp. UWO310]
MTWELSDLLRAIATTIVIGIHASHPWWFGVHGTNHLDPEIFIDTAVNQVGRFTVPIFVILSGFALAKSEEKRPFELSIFIQRRLWRIVPPYVLFTLLNTVGRSQFLAGNWLDRGQQIGQALASGMGDYHLYFLGIIFQCYVAYPFLRRLSFSPHKLVALLFITFALFSLRWLSATFGWLPSLTNLLPDGNHVIYWLPYFQLGIWLAKDRGWTNEIVSAWRSPRWGYLFVIATVIELSEFYGSAILKNSAEAVGHYTRPTVVFLTLTFLLWSISWRNWEIKSPAFAISPIFKPIFNPIPQLWRSLQAQIKAQKIKAQIQIFSKASFTTYLIHVWVLRTIAPLEIVGGILYLPLAIALSWLGGITVWRLLLKFQSST